MLVIRKKVKRSKLLCAHKYIRGVNQGKFCEDKAMIGYRYCKTHFKKNSYMAKFISRLERHIGNLLDVELVKNEFGEYEDQYTGFIFSVDSQKILGKRLTNRDLGKLDIYDIALSVKKGWDIFSNDDSSDSEN
jgi:hypothetical protein